MTPARTVKFKHLMQELSRNERDNAACMEKIAEQFSAAVAMIEVDPPLWPALIAEHLAIADAADELLQQGGASDEEVVALVDRVDRVCDTALALADKMRKLLRSAKAVPLHQPKIKIKFVSSDEFKRLARERGLPVEPIEWDGEDNT